MGRDISMMISARDNYSGALAKMSAATKEFAAKADGLSQKLDFLNKNKVTLKMDAKTAKNELTAAEKQFRKTGDEADRLNMAAKMADYDNITSNLKLVSDQARQTERDMNSLTDGLSRHQNRAAGGAGASGGGLLSGLGKAGITQMLGDTLSGAADSLISSGLGDTMGGVVSSVIGKAASGAAIGSMIGGPLGAAVGTAAGAVMGAVDGAIQVFEKKDDAFKDTVSESYNATRQAQSDALTAGSSIAAGRETGLIQWTTLLGDEAKAKAFAGDLKDMANTTPFEYDELDKMAKTMKTYGYEAEEILPKLRQVGDAGAALGMGAADINMTATAIGRMKLSDKTSMEYLNMLTERGVPAVRFLSEALGKSKNEIYDMVSKGLIPGSKAAQIITDAMGREYGGSMEKIALTFSGLGSSLEDARSELNNAMGEGYNQERKQGIEAEMNFLSGAAGEKMQQAYGMIGQWKASLENLKGQFEQDAITAVMEGSLGSLAGTKSEERLIAMAEQYRRQLAQQAIGNEEAGAKMGALIAEAQVIAQNEYMASTGQQTELQANLDLIGRIQNDSSLNDAYYNTGLKLGDALSQGIVSGIMRSGDPVSAAIGSFAGTGGSFGNGDGGGYIPFFGKTNAWGQLRVPYDNYPALLHEGEKVTPRSAAEGGDRGGVVVNVYGLTVRQEADVEKVAKTLYRELSLARTVATGG